MLKKVILLLLVALTFTCRSHGVSRSDSLLRCLDKAVQNKVQLSEERRKHIAESLADLHNATDDSEKYNILRTLYSQYRSYKGDSALWVAGQRMKVAARIGDTSKINSASLNLAESYSLAGDYHHVLSILDSLRRTELNVLQKKYLYTLYRTIFERMAKSDLIQSNVLTYESRQKAYTDSVLSLTDETDSDYDLTRGTFLTLSGHPQEALTFIDRALTRNNPKDKSRILTRKAAALASLHREDEEMEALAEAAISDLGNGQNDYSALPRLALILLRRGDTERAYTYIHRALEDARVCNAKSRTTEILELLPAIESEHAEAGHRRISSLILLLSIVAVLTVALAVLLVLLRKRNRAIRNFNRSLHEINATLSQSNRQLEASNREKVKFITEVFDAHSGYITRMKTLRAALMKLLKSNQPAKARQMLEREDENETELKELYIRFDSIFLRLYPDFLKDYNNTARAECKVDEKAQSLTAELRVLALIKIGIKRSSQIAELLHYSPQTVYNYKSILRNSLNMTKEEFERWIEDKNKPDTD